MSETKISSFSAKNTQEEQIKKLQSLLSLPVAERNTLLAQNSAILAEIFTSGSEEMEWVEDYIEDDNWDE